MPSSREKGFTQAIGRWSGTAEVYDGAGRFLGNAADRRHVSEVVGENRVRIELSFIGPFKFAGHYFIEDHKTHRLYQGPANVGYAETLSANLIDANAYWAVTGLSQRFFLMIAPDGDSQISLGLMSRGEHLLYTVVGEYRRLSNGDPASDIPDLVNGTHYDLGADPAAGRAEILLHRSGTWSGELTFLDGDLGSETTATYRESVMLKDDLILMGIENRILGLEFSACELRTDNFLGWSLPGNLAGSYSLAGGRALSGHFHHLDKNLRVWRREVAAHDGLRKAVLHTWYRGGRRVGVQFGVLDFEPA